MQQTSNTSATQPIAIKVEELGAHVRCYELASGRPPLFIEPADGVLTDGAAFQTWSASVRPTLDALILRHGGIVLRGFPTPDTANFAQVVDLFPAFEGGYAGGVAPRTQISGKVMEATRQAATQKLPLHSEMAYMANYPKRIAFFCKLASPVGGETIIGDMRTLVEDLPAALVERIERLGVRTVRNYAPQSEAMERSVDNFHEVGWNLAFGTTDRTEVASLCAERGLTPTWRDDGGLTVSNHTEAFLRHPHTGKKLYRSIVHAFRPEMDIVGESAEVKKARQKKENYNGSFLGDGESLSDQEVKQFKDCIDKLTYAWPWRNGDIMILDNLQVWHGRNPYEGPRDVQVALLA